MVGRLLILLLGVASLAASLFFTCQGFRYRELAEGIAWLPDRRLRDSRSWSRWAPARRTRTRIDSVPSRAVGLGARIVLVDAGRGVAEALRHCSIPVAQPDTVAAHEPASREHRRPRRSAAHRLEHAAHEAAARARSAGDARARRCDRRRARRRRSAALATARGVDAAGARIEVIEIGDGFSETQDGLHDRARGDGRRADRVARVSLRGRAIAPGSCRALNPDPEKLGDLRHGRDAAGRRRLLRASRSRWGSRRAPRTPSSCAAKRRCTCRCSASRRRRHAQASGRWW